MPANFPGANQFPGVGNNVIFLPRASNNLGSNGGIAMVDREGGTFFGWVRVWEIPTVLARMAQIQPVRGRVSAITDDFNHGPGGGRCCEGRVDIF